MDFVLQKSDFQKTTKAKWLENVKMTQKMGFRGRPATLDFHGCWQPVTMYTQLLATIGPFMPVRSFFGLFINLKFDKDPHRAILR